MFGYKILHYSTRMLLKTTRSTKTHYYNFFLKKKDWFYFVFFMYLYFFMFNIPCIMDQFIKK
jgi:hypothetical protein